ncbi:amidohydrolase family protein [Amycolatopsis pithecellobii]|uniref:Amidohydrolase family protein n=1 Tax=Amycolatopsis pithecellobii TaxID=664692 RepID=A0A6N7YM39_9PSEU|nr:amidohydrolase family protein [Amycolatopsis pithecellobii]MTD52918.1 amidohydrolase family protein [Amycolatopsis pithecellobii]
MYSGRRIAVEEGYLTQRASDLARQVYASEEARQLGTADALSQVFLPGITEERWARNMDLGEGRIAVMDEARLDMQLLVLSYQGSQMLDPAHAVAEARGINDELAAAVRRYPSRLAGLASLPTSHPEAAAVELERAVRSLGLRGTVIHSHTRGDEWPQRGIYLDEPEMWPIFEAAESLRVPVYLHPSQPSPQLVRAFTQYGMMGPIWGYNVEASTHLVRVILSGVFDIFPELTLVVGHLGEGIPFYFERLDAAYAQSNPKQRLKMPPSEYFRRNIYLTTSGMNSAAALPFCIDVLSADRIMFAADYPQDPSPLADEVAAMDRLEITDAEKAAIFSGNAEKVFGLV